MRLSLRLEDEQKSCAIWVYHNQASPLPIGFRNRLVTYYVLFLIRLDIRQVEVAGMTPHPNEVWVNQIAQYLTMDECGFLENCRNLIHDRDKKTAHHCVR